MSSAQQSPVTSGIVSCRLLGHVRSAYCILGNPCGRDMKEELTAFCQESMIISFVIPSSRTETKSMLGHVMLYSIKLYKRQSIAIFFYNEACMDAIWQMQMWHWCFSGKVTHFLFLDAISPCRFTIILRHLPTSCGFRERPSSSLWVADPGVLESIWCGAGVTLPLWVTPVSQFREGIGTWYSKGSKGGWVKFSWWYWCEYMSDIYWLLGLFNNCV